MKENRGIGEVKNKVLYGGCLELQRGQVRILMGKKK